MKMRLLINLTLLTVIFASVSCKDSGNGSRLSVVSGATNELLVVMNKAMWEGAAGDTIKAYFGQSQLGLPQSEPLFDLLNLPLSFFKKNVKTHRNVLMVSISNKVDSASITFRESPWSRSQKFFEIKAPNDKEFYRIFDENKAKMVSVYLKAERDRLVEVYKKTPDSKIFTLFRDKYDMLLYCPEGYKVNKDSADFVWMSYETRVDSKGIVFFQEKYVDQSQLNYQVIMDRMNEVLKANIPGPLKNTWMALDMELPVSAATYNYDGLYYAVMLKGLWTVVNDFMGGPYVLNVVLDEKNNRVIYMMGYVYAPENTKRNMLRQVESILYSMKLDIEQPKK